MEGHGQPEMDESLPFQTGVKPQLLGWLCFWTFIGLGLPWFQVPFFDYPNPEEDSQGGLIDSGGLLLMVLGLITV